MDVCDFYFFLYILFHLVFLEKYHLLLAILAIYLSESHPTKKIYAIIGLWTFIHYLRFGWF